MGKSITATTTIKVVSKSSLVSNFDGVETNLKEGGIWQHKDPTLTLCQKKNGVAFGTQDGSGGFDDSQVYATGFGNDHEVEGVVWLKPGTPSGPNREVEILLRWTDDNPLRDTQYGPSQALGYEINWSHSGFYLILGRFKGPELTRAPNCPSPKTGDRFRARIVGQTITAWINNVLQFQFTDNSTSEKIVKGNPGIGFYIDAGAKNDDFGFDSVKITTL